MKVLLLSFFLAVTLLVSDTLGLEEEEFYEDDDVVVIEAAERADEGRDEGRKARQIYQLVQQPYGLVQPWLYQQPLPQQPPPLPLPPPQGQACKTKKEKSGICSTVQQCYPYFKLSTFGSEDTWVMGTYDTCSLNVEGGKLVYGVCCAASNSTGDVDTKEPEGEADEDDEDVEEAPTQGGLPIKFSQLRTNCGARTGFNNDFRIVNGQIASINEFPFMCALLNRNRQFCGGSLVDDTHVLTAAHCVAHMSKLDVQNLKVVLGDHNLKQQGETKGNVLEYNVKRVVRHKNFDNTKLYNDVAILTLDQPVQRSETIQPICLAVDDNESFEGRLVEVAGWGTTSSGGSQSSEVLRKVDVKVWSNHECHSSYGSEAPGGIISSMVCASLKEERKDSCSGDSGGPLFKCDGPHGPCQQLGIVSWGIGCAQERYPGVYTRISSFAPWISRIMKKY